MIIVGINAYHPDASVALLKDGNLVWAGEEERFNRIKHASGFPTLALRQCLKDTGILPRDIDYVAISKNPKANLWRKIRYTIKNRPGRALISNRVRAFKRATHLKKDIQQALEGKSDLRAGIIHVEHHRSHVASTFFCSGMSKAAFMTFDGLGDFCSAMWGVGEERDLRVMDRVFFPHSAGFLYTAATQFLGFHHFGDEYKVMGLAAYGKPTLKEKVEKMVLFKERGQFELNLNYFEHPKGKAKVRWEGGAPDQDMLFSSQWAEEFGAPRRPGSPISDRDCNLAASTQALLEEIYFRILNHIYKATGEDNLCLAGGVALNSLANGKIKQHTPFKNIYIQPAAGDAGTAIGAALYVYHTLKKYPRKFKMDHAYFGPHYQNDRIEDLLKDRKITHRKADQGALIQEAVEVLTKGGIVGWFQGNMEFGPRALGARSILADPRREDMKDILNERIKKRENFRPFAPIIPDEHANEYFEMDCENSPFMLKVFPVREEKRKVIPAVTHLDGTARVQTVSEKSNPLLHALLTSFGESTGVPVLINTSFNENEPIVCTPDEALNCFIKTNMDLLILESFLIKK